MRILKNLFICTFALSILISCSTGNKPVYQLNTSSNPSEAGSVSPSQGEYDKGTEVNVVATPNEHWIFDKWQGDHSGSQNPATITMDSDKSITALFVKREYPLTINIEGEGAVDEQVVQQKSTDYAHGTVVELTANPAEGWEFVEWQGDLSGSENPSTIAVDEEKNVSALFELSEYEVIISIEGEGSFSISPDKNTYHYEDEITITVIPDDGWNFVHWGVDLKGGENPMTIKIEDNLNVVAVLDNSPFAGGDGSEMYPYQVSNLEQLQAIEKYLNKNFVQISDIDASSTVDTVFEPLGDAVVKFKGTYDGGGFKIKKLTIEQTSYSGLFGFCEEVQIKNLEIINISIPKGYSYVGGICGYLSSGEIVSSHVSGTVSGYKYKDIIMEGETIGGLIGENHGEIRDSYFEGDVTGMTKFGGLVGLNRGTIRDSHATGNVYKICTDCEIYDNGYVGGLVGDNSGEITGSYFYGEVFGERIIGGLAGSNGGSITHSFADVNVSGTYSVGGLVGSNSGDIINSYVSGKVSGKGGIGGLTGENTGSISYTKTNVNLSGNGRLGGLVGENYSTGSVVESYSIGDVLGSFGSTGGLVGQNSGQIDNSYSTGKVEGDSGVGGLVGINRDEGSILTSYSIGKTSGNEDVGGLIGVNGATIQSSYWDTQSSAQDDGIGRGSSDGATGLNTSEMHGSATQDNMPEFDWDAIWKTVSNDYPILRWQDE